MSRIPRRWQWNSLPRRHTLYQLMPLKRCREGNLLPMLSNRMLIPAVRVVRIMPPILMRKLNQNALR